MSNDLIVATKHDVARIAPTGTGRTELVCRTCGYGAVADAPPARCPMCQGSSWRIALPGGRNGEGSWRLP